MSLDYRLTNIRDRQELIQEENWGTTQSIIFTCMITRVDEFKTEADADEAYLRYRLVYGDSVTLTRDDFRRMIGLWTNCFPRLKRSKWLTDAESLLFESVESRVNMEHARLSASAND